MKTHTWKPIIGVGLMFASNGAMFASLLPWYPLLMHRWGIREGIFGLIVACFALGSIVSSAVPAPIVKKYGPLRTMVWASVLMAVVLGVGAAQLRGGIALALLLLAVGFVDPIVDVAQNVVAVKVQDAVGFSIMSSVHAAWSLGAAAGGAAATMAVGKLPMHWHMALACSVALALAVVGRWMVGQVSGNDEASDGDERGRLSAVWLVLPIVVVAISGTAVEEFANNWAPIMAVDLVGLPIGNSGVALTLMLVTQCIGRFLGDPMINRWGRVAVARLGGAFITGGIVLAMFSHAPTLFLCGIALAGFGCTTIVPSAFAAASKIPGVSPSVGLTLVSWLMRIGFLATSPLIGFVAETASLRSSLAIIAVGGATIVILGSRLEPRAKNQQ